MRAELAEKGFVGIATLVFSVRAIFHFAQRYRSRGRPASLALAFVSASCFLCALPLFEVVPREWLWVFRWTNAAVLAFLFWAIIRVDQVELGRLKQQETGADVQRWRTENRDYLDQLEARRRKRQ